MQTDPLLEKKLSFESFGLRPEILRAVAEKQYTTPTPIQEKAIPIVLEGKDLIGCARPAPGRRPPSRCRSCTASREHPGEGPVGAPSASSCSRRRGAGLPDRGELRRIRQAHGPQARHRLRRREPGPAGAGAPAGIDILVATPGRLLDLMSQGLVQLRTVETFVLDEATGCSTWLHPRHPARHRPAAREAADPLLLGDDAAGDPGARRYHPSGSRPGGRHAGGDPREAVEQRVHYVEKSEKIKLLKHLLDGPAIKNALVFTRTKHGADAVTKQLERYQVRAEAIHGNKSQNAREKALSSFKRGVTRVLVATDIAARGLDIVDLSHVVNFDLPNEPESYVHRIGRTGRAGASGIALSFCSFDERPFLADIERLIRRHLPVAEDHPYRSGYGTGTPTNLDPRQAHGAAALSMVHPDMVSRRASTTHRTPVPTAAPAAPAANRSGSGIRSKQAGPAPRGNIAARSGRIIPSP